MEVTLLKVNSFHKKKLVDEKTRSISKALAVAQEIANKENKAVQLDLYHLQHGEIRPLSTYIPQNLDEYRCLQGGEPKEVLIEPAIMDLYNNKEHTDRTPALTEPHHNTLRVREGMKIRRLTPIECERLQGFPDNWTEGFSDSQRYKMMGNAVTVNVIKTIAEKLI